MATWGDVQASAPELAEAVQRCFDAFKHKVMATVRADGSPRVSGTELTLWRDDWWWGSGEEAIKTADLRRDPRVALHSAPGDEELTLGDAKLAGRAILVDDVAVIAAFMADQGHELEGEVEPFPFFRLDITEVGRVSLGGDPPDHLRVESWHPGRGYEVQERR